MHVLSDRSVIDTKETLELTELSEKGRKVTRKYRLKVRGDAASHNFHDIPLDPDPRWSGLQHVRD